MGENDIKLKILKCSYFEHKKSLENLPENHPKRNEIVEQVEKLKTEIEFLENKK